MITNFIFYVLFLYHTHRLTNIHTQTHIETYKYNIGTNKKITNILTHTHTGNPTYMHINIDIHISISKNVYKNTPVHIFMKNKNIYITRFDLRFPKLTLKFV